MAVARWFRGMLVDAFAFQCLACDQTLEAESASLCEGCEQELVGPSFEGRCVLWNPSFRCGITRALSKR